MRVVFRADASNHMGTGHLMRCLTLAEALRKRGLDPRFICRAHSGHLIDLLQRRAMPVTILPAPPESEVGGLEDYAAWLGVSQRQDAEETVDALAGQRPDWLIVDHYGLDAAWEQRLRPHVKRLMVLDDLANRPHDCDLLLDQNFKTDLQTRYRGRVSAACRLLLGPRYALLRPEYGAWRKTLRPYDGRARRVLVFLGGSDPHNVTGLVLEVLSAPEFRHLHVDVVIGASHAHRSRIKTLAQQRPQTALYGPRPHLADLMAQADLAIGAGGASTWERLCLGLPSLVVSIADNQKPACLALAQAGLIHYEGDVTALDRQRLSGSLARMIDDPNALTEMSTTGRLLVDGLGALRTAEAIDPTPIDKLRLRPVREEDVTLYYAWANDPKVRGPAFHGDPIPWARHHTWFHDKLAGARSHLFVLEVNGLPVGQIRFDRENDEARIDYSLDPLVRGRGWAARLVTMGGQWLHAIEPVALRAEVKSGNHASRAVFLRLGFEKQVDASGGGRRFSLAILSDRGTWFNAYLPELILDWLDAGHRVLWSHAVSELREADFCFYLSCGEIVPSAVLAKFRHNLVVHGSNLPQGKGWSPLTWQILEGRNRIPVTLFEAAEKVDSGVIYGQEWMDFEGHELIDELRTALARATLALCRRFVAEYPKIVSQARPQTGDESFYPRRKPDDSRLDPGSTLPEQFQLLRVVDNECYPAFFEWQGCVYTLRIRKGQ